MRNREFRISFGYKLIATALLLLTVYACQTVYTAHPLPSADTPPASALPDLMAGDYLIVEEDMKGSEREPGNQYVSITLSDPQHCLVETYYGFHMDELASHTNAERFRVTGNYLIYKNDSLIQELTRARALAESSPENEEYQKALKTLERLEENGYLNHITPLTKRGQLLTYNREPVFEIDLTNSLISSYEDPNLMEEHKVNIRQRDQYLYLSSPDSDHGWENLILELSQEGIKGLDISFKHVLNNKARYEKTANLNQPGKNTIIIDPSLDELDNMLTEEGFLEEEVTLKRIELEEEDSQSSNASWLLIALGSIFLIILLRAMRKPQTHS